MVDGHVPAYMFFWLADRRQWGFVESGGLIPDDCNEMQIPVELWNERLILKRHVYHPRITQHVVQPAIFSLWDQNHPSQSYPMFHMVVLEGRLVICKEPRSSDGFFCDRRYGQGFPSIESILSREEGLTRTDPTGSPACCHYALTSSATN